VSLTFHDDGFSIGARRGASEASVSDGERDAGVEGAFMGDREVGENVASKERTHDDDPPANVTVRGPVLWIFK
jgi:hypothetical protein